MISCAAEVSSSAFGSPDLLSTLGVDLIDEPAEDSCGGVVVAVNKVGQHDERSVQLRVKVDLDAVVQVEPSYLSDQFVRPFSQDAPLVSALEMFGGVGQEFAHVLAKRFGDALEEATGAFEGTGKPPHGGAVDVKRTQFFAVLIDQGAADLGKLGTGPTAATMGHNTGHGNIEDVVLPAGGFLRGDCAVLLAGVFQNVIAELSRELAVGFNAIANLEVFAVFDCFRHNQNDVAFGHKSSCAHKSGTEH